jgi:hypothetical protein
VKRKFLNGILFLFFVSAAALAQMEVEIVPLQHRRAEEIIPAIEGLVDEGGMARGQGSQLILKSSRATIEQIKGVVRGLDRRLRQFVISVQERARGEGGSTDLGVGGSVVAGKKIRIQNGQVRARSDSFTDHAQTTHQVRVVEGARAQIGGELSLSLRAQSSGVEIEVQRSGPSDFHSTLLAPFGQWIDLGSVSLSGSGNNSRILGRSSQKSSSEQRIWVRIEEESSK